MAAVDATPDLSSRGKNSAHQYLDAFFGDISDPARLQQQIIGHCRN